MCSVGNHLGDDCTPDVPFKTALSLKDLDLKVLKLRLDCVGIENICVRHENKFLRHYALNQKTCCDPLKEHPDKSKRNTLQEIDTTCMMKYSTIVKLIPGKKTCLKCRLSLAKQLQKYHECCNADERPVGGTVTPHKNDNIDFDNDENFSTPSCEHESVNKSLQLIGESPVDASKLKGKKYPKRKIKKIKLSFAKKLKLMSPESSQAGQSLSSDEETSKIEDYNTLMSQLKEKFQSCNNRSKQVTILSVLPKNWSVRRVQEEFGATKYMAEQTKKLVAEQGILATTKPKPGKALTATTVKLVQDLYEDDEVSRMMPGMKDTVSVKEGSKRVTYQKRLMLNNLKETYELFKKQNPDVKIGFTKFAELRPKYCVLPGGAGTHSVCVCTIHQNVKLMILGAKLPSFADREFHTYHQILENMMCTSPAPNCHLGKCLTCPGTDKLQHDLEALFDEEMIDEISFKQWETTDRCNIITMQMSSDDFITRLLEKLEILRTHDFIARQQASYLKELKSILEPGEVIVTGDFSENYSFVVQDAAQGFHWNNSQATLHPFVCYYVQDGELNHSSYVFISDCLHHDTVAVYSFQKQLIPLLQEKVGIISKVIYFSDGAASQYKNKKNFVNLCEHEADFGVKAEWHFFATSHGKGPCDGVGGTVKRHAAKASLQRPYNEQILTAYDLFKWAEEKISKNIIFKFVSSEEIAIIKEKLEDRFHSVQRIVGTRGFHAYLPTSKTTLQAKLFSASTECEEVKVIATLKGQKQVSLQDICDYVTVSYDGQWWLGFVLKKLESSNELSIRFLYPHGPSPSFTYPSKDDELVVNIDQVLTTARVELGGLRGRTYKLNQEDSDEATRKLACLHATH